MTLFNCVFYIGILAFFAVLTMLGHSPSWGNQETSKVHTSASLWSSLLAFWFSEDDHMGHLPVKLRVHHIIYHQPSILFKAKEVF